MPLGWLVVHCALFALAYGILVFGYRSKKLSLRRFAILLAVRNMDRPEVGRSAGQRRPGHLELTEMITP